MNIGKLGITNPPWTHNGMCCVEYNNKKDVLLSCVEGTVVRGNEEEDHKTARLIAAAPEMLDALVEEWVFIENFLAVWAESVDNHQYNKFNNRAEKIVSIIEKATGKTWEEVKELIK